MTEDDVLKIFGENVRKQREKKNLTIKEFSQKTKIREQYLIKIENGNAVNLPLSYVFILSEGLKIKPHILCFGI